ncbi:MAG: hypothetical protein ACI8TL_000492 [Natronomonas sp.]|jgi:hypothetical protein
MRRLRAAWITPVTGCLTLCVDISEDPLLDVVLDSELLSCPTSACWRYPRASAGAVIVSFSVFHDVWELDGEARRGDRINFLKNAALLGGAIILLDEADS